MVPGSDPGRDDRRLGKWQYRQGVNLAELLLLVAGVVLPLVLGAAAAVVRRPWWWVAVVAAVLVTVAMVVPEPEAGEARLAWGDVPFVLGVVLFVTGLVWLSNFLVRRIGQRRDASRRATR